MLAPRVLGPNQGGVTAGDVEVRLRQGGFRVVDQDGEERPALVHAAQQVESIGGVVVDELLQRVAEAIPGRKEMAGLRPGKDPGNRAQVAEVVGAETTAGARSQPDAFDEVDRV